MQKDTKSTANTPVSPKGQQLNTAPKNPPVEKPTPKAESTKPKAPAAPTAVLEPEAPRNSGRTPKYTKLDPALSRKEKSAARKKARASLFKLTDEILLADKKSKVTPELLDGFLDYYKANYTVQDFTIESLYQGADIIKRQELQKVLDLLEKHLAKTEAIVPPKK